MATNQIRRTGADPAAKADGKSGVTIDAGPYEAVIMKYVEGTRSGQLMVYIPDLGGVKPLLRQDSYRPAAGMTILLLSCCCRLPRRGHRWREHAWRAGHSQRHRVPGGLLK